MDPEKKYWWVSQIVIPALSVLVALITLIVMILKDNKGINLPPEDVMISKNNTQTEQGGEEKKTNDDARQDKGINTPPKKEEGGEEFNGDARYPKIDFGILEEYFVISNHKKGKFKHQGMFGKISYLDGIIVNVKARRNINYLATPMLSACYYDKDNVMIRDSFISMTPKYPEAGWREGMPGEVFIPYLKEWNNVATILIESSSY